jgi:hypothetical protein
MTGQQRKFAQGVAIGLNQAKAYRAAYPKCSAKAAESKASRLVRNGRVRDYVNDLRLEAHTKTVMIIREKREFLARVVRCKVFEEPPESDVWASIKHTEHGLEMKLPDKIAAIKADNDLAGEGSEAEGRDALREMLKSI